MIPAGLRTLLLYAVAGVLYITLSVFFPKFILSWVEGAAFLLLLVVVLPMLVRRLLR
jgi:hypothetical protein